MGKYVSENDYQEIFGNPNQPQPNQPQDYTRVEFISNTKPCIIDTAIFPTEKTQFEIKISLSGRPLFAMGCFDFSKGRKVARFFSCQDNITYDFPDDWGKKGRASCGWNMCSPDNLHKDFPHIIKFGNIFVEDITSGRSGRFGHLENSFSTNAPFGLFGIVEYNDEGIPLKYIIPKQETYKIYYFKVYESDNLIANMVPVIDGEGRLCMYDLVREQFFRPVNEAGEEVNLTKPKAAEIEQKKTNPQPDAISFKGIMKSVLCSLMGTTPFGINERYKTIGRFNMSAKNTEYDRKIEELRKIITRLQRRKKIKVGDYIGVLSDGRLIIGSHSEMRDDNIVTYVRVDMLFDTYGTYFIRLSDSFNQNIMSMLYTYNNRR